MQAMSMCRLIVLVTLSSLNVLLVAIECFSFTTLSVLQSHLDVRYEISSPAPEDKKD